MTRILPCALLLVVSAAACRGARGPAPRAPTMVATAAEAFDLTGTVRAEVTGQPVAGVVIVVEGQPERRAVTDAAGAYHIPALPLGAYLVSARKLGHYVERRELAVTCPVVIVDTAGRPIAGGGACAPDRPVLNFFLRAQTLR